MNTPAHLIFASAAFARPDKPKTIWAAIAGGLAPDFSLYFLTLWSRFISGNSFQYIFNTQYFSDAWQAVFRIDNSFIVWGIILALGFWLKRAWLIAFAGGALLHIALDLPLHHDDGRAHFWPISNWIFESPISYWDGNHFGHIVAPIEVALVIAATIILWRRFSESWHKYLFAAIAATQVAPAIIFGLMF